MIDPQKDLAAILQRCCSNPLSSFLRFSPTPPTDHQFHDGIMKDHRGVVQHPVLKKWLYLPEVSEDFESMAMEIVEAITMNDQRFGVEPKERKGRKPR